MPQIIPIPSIPLAITRPGSILSPIQVAPLQLPIPQQQTSSSSPSRLAPHRHNKHNPADYTATTTNGHKHNSYRHHHHHYHDDELVMPSPRYQNIPYASGNGQPSKTTLVGPLYLLNRSAYSQSPNLPQPFSPARQGPTRTTGSMNGWSVASGLPSPAHSNSAAASPKVMPNTKGGRKTTMPVKRSRSASAHRIRQRNGALRRKYTRCEEAVYSVGEVCYWPCWSPKHLVAKSACHSPQHTSRGCHPPRHSVALPSPSLLSKSLLARLHLNVNRSVARLERAYAAWKAGLWFEDEDDDDLLVGNGDNSGGGTDMEVTMMSRVGKYMPLRESPSKSPVATPLPPLVQTANATNSPTAAEKVPASRFASAPRPMAGRGRPVVVHPATNLNPHHTSPHLLMLPKELALPLRYLGEVIRAGKVEMYPSCSSALLDSVLAHLQLRESNSPTIGQKGAEKRGGEEHGCRDAELAGLFHALDALYQWVDEQVAGRFTHLQNKNKPVVSGGEGDVRRDKETGVEGKDAGESASTPQILATAKLGLHLLTELESMLAVVMAKMRATAFGSSSNMQNMSPTAAPWLSLSGPNQQANGVRRENRRVINSPRILTPSRSIDNELRGLGAVHASVNSPPWDLSFIDSSSVSTCRNQTNSNNNNNEPLIMQCGSEKENEEDLTCAAAQKGRNSQSSISTITSGEQQWPNLSTGLADYAKKPSRLSFPSNMASATAVASPSPSTPDGAKLPQRLPSLLPTNSSSYKPGDHDATRGQHHRRVERKRLVFAQHRSSSAFGSGSSGVWQRTEQIARSMVVAHDADALGAEKAPKGELVLQGENCKGSGGKTSRLRFRMPRRTNPLALDAGSTPNSKAMLMVGSRGGIGHSRVGHHNGGGKDRYRSSKSLARSAATSASVMQSGGGGRCGRGDEMDGERAAIPLASYVTLNDNLRFYEEQQRQRMSSRKSKATRIMDNGRNGQPNGTGAESREGGYSPLLEKAARLTNFGGNSTYELETTENGRMNGSRHGHPHGTHHPQCASPSFSSPIPPPSQDTSIASSTSEYLDLRHLLQATTSGVSVGDQLLLGDVILPKKFFRNSEGKNLANGIGSEEIEVLRKLDVSDYLMLRRRDRHSKPTEVRAGPKCALIVYATQNSSPLIYQEAFLVTYRSFVSSQELIQHLIRRYLHMMEAAAAETPTSSESNIRTINVGGVDNKEKTSSRLPSLPASLRASQKAARQTFSMLVRVVDELCVVELSRELIHSVTSFVYRLIRAGDYDFARLLRRRLMERIVAKSASIKQRSKGKLARHTTSPGAATPAANGDKHSESSTASTETSHGGSGGSVLDHRSAALAAQLTALDQELFAKIEPAEMLWWAESQDPAKAPNLVHFTEHFNRLSFWVRTQVLRPVEQRERERLLLKFVKVMRQLRRMGNFNSYLAILSALDSGPMRRLDWSRQVRTELADHAAVMDSSHSFRNYRQLLAEQPPPCLPYVGLILQDLTFVHVGNPDKLQLAPAQPAVGSDITDGDENCNGDGDTMEQNKGGGGGEVVELINYGKRWQQFAILDNVRRFKAWPYAVQRDERVLSEAFHEFLPAFDEEETWTRSFELKPKRASSNV